MFNLRRIVLILAALGIFGLVAVGFSNTHTVEAGFVSTGDGSWVWLNPLPHNKNINGVSCPTDNFCGAVGNGGVVMVNDSGGWRTQNSGTFVILYDISCLNPTFCIAVGYDGVILKYDGISWSSQISGSTDILNSVSCATTSFCFASSYNATSILQYNGSSWNNVATGTTGLSHYSCTSPTFCAAINDITNGAIYNGSSWTSSPANGGSLRAISCTSSTFCLAVGSGPTAAVYNGTSWTSNNPPFAISGFSSVSCSSSTNCITAGSTLRFNGTNWATIYTGLTVGITDVSCSSLNNCVGVGGQGAIARFNGNSWRVEGGSPDQSNELVGVSCASTTACTYVGGTNHTGFDGISWRIQNDPQFIAGGGRAVSCPTPTACFSTTQQGQIIQYDGKAWSLNYESINVLSGINCLTVTFCMAVGLDNSQFPVQGVSYRYNGTTWTKIAIPTNANAQSVSCVNINLCFAVVASGGIFKYNGTSWLPETTPNLVMLAVSCVNSNFCMAVGSGAGNALVGYSFMKYNGASWTTLDSNVDSSLSGLNAVSCPTTTYCTAVGRNGSLFEYNGTTFTRTNFDTGAFYNLFSVSCLNPSFCVVVGDSNVVLAKVKLTVNSTATTNTPGTLVYALAHATEPQIINFDLPGGSVINLAGQVPVIPAGVIVRGSCGIGGPGITLNVTNVTGGIGVSGGNALYGLKITSSNGKLLSLLGTGNKLGCVSLIKT